MTEPFVPLSQRVNPDMARAHVETMHDGVPPWLRDSLLMWLVKEVRHPVYRGGGGGYRSAEFVGHGLEVTLAREIERKCRLDLRWDGEFEVSGLSALERVVKADEAGFLDVVEYVSITYATPESREVLEEVLAEAGSRWRVSTATGRFEDRVAATVVAAAKAVFSEGAPGALLQKAWESAFSRNPDASDAYRQAIRAVEAAAQGIVLPKSSKATLGTIIAALKQGKHKFKFAFAVDSAVDPMDVLISMMQMLWTNQYDRHVNDETPLHVSQDEGEAAVLLALTLVQWCLSGFLVSQP